MLSAFVANAQVLTQAQINDGFTKNISALYKRVDVADLRIASLKADSVAKNKTIDSLKIELVKVAKNDTIKTIDGIKYVDGIVKSIAADTAFFNKFYLQKNILSAKDIEAAILLIANQSKSNMDRMATTEPKLEDAIKRLNLLETFFNKLKTLFL